MKKQKIFLILTITIISIVCFWLYINQPYTSIKSLKTQEKINAKQLTVLFLKNEEKANQKFREKVIEVSGTIKNINLLNQNSNIILNGSHVNHNIICQIELHKKEKITKLQIGQKVNIKGICKGYLKDVILLNCTLVNSTNNE